MDYAFDFLEHVPDVYVFQRLGLTLVAAVFFRQQRAHRLPPDDRQRVTSLLLSRLAPKAAAKPEHCESIFSFALRVLVLTAGEWEFGIHTDTTHPDSTKVPSINTTQRLMLEVCARDRYSRRELCDLLLGFERIGAVLPATIFHLTQLAGLRGFLRCRASGGTMTPVPFEQPTATGRLWSALSSDRSDADHDDVELVEASFAESASIGLPVVGALLLVLGTCGKVFRSDDVARQLRSLKKHDDDFNLLLRADPWWSDPIMRPILVSGICALAECGRERVQLRELSEGLWTLVDDPEDSTALQLLWQRLKSDCFKVMLYGMHSSGKSSLLNALLPGLNLPVATEEASSHIVKIRFERTETSQSCQAILHFKPTVQLSDVCAPELRKSLPAFLVEHLNDPKKGANEPLTLPPGVLDSLARVGKATAALNALVSHFEVIYSSPQVPDVPNGSVEFFDTPGTSAAVERRDMTEEFRGEADLCILLTTFPTYQVSHKRRIMSLSQDDVSLHTPCGRRRWSSKPR